MSLLKRRVVEYGPYAYRIMEDGTIKISSVAEDESKDIVIPEMIDGRTVTSIAEYAFYENWVVKSVHIPDTVTDIGYSAFEIRRSTYQDGVLV